MGTTDAQSPVLVVGAPRAATTWVGQVLGVAPGTCSVHEPDNEANVPLAVKAKLALGRFPVLGAGEEAPAAFDQLWAGAFDCSLQPRTPLWYAAKLLLKRVNRAELRAGFCEPTGARLSARLRTIATLAAPPSRSRTGSGEYTYHVRRKGIPIPPSARGNPNSALGGAVPRRTIVKSINAPLALEWIAARFHPTVVIVLRHPLNVVASWLDLGWRECNLDRNPRVRERFIEGQACPPIDANSSPLARLTWQIGLLTKALEMSIAAHSDWLVASHEALCLDPAGGFRGLYDELGLGWSDEVDTWLTTVNRPGTGTLAHRVASEQPERWRTRLNADQVREIRDVLAGFRLSSWPSDL